MTPIHTRHTRSPGRGGFTVVEMAVVSTILVIGALGTVGSVVAGLRLVRVNREVAMAHEAARAMCERMQATDFAEVFATYNTDPADDPDGAGTASGADFTVASVLQKTSSTLTLSNLAYLDQETASVTLSPVKGDSDGCEGEILFPTTSGAGAQVFLDETLVDPRWGMPRDLDGDGQATNKALSAGYLVLPVRIRMRWQGAGQSRVLEFDQFLIAR